MGREGAVQSKTEIESWNALSSDTAQLYNQCITLEQIQLCILSEPIILL